MLYGGDMSLSRCAYICLALAMLLAFSCAHGASTDPLSSQLTENSNPAFAQYEIPRGHSLLGLDRVTVDTVSMTMESVPLRSSQWHLNALKFLEPEDNVSLIKFSAVEIIGHKVNFNVTIKHPFPALHYYAGFDVKGIVLGAADMVDLTGDSRRWAGGPNGLRLLNADGWTRWWNPIEFPDNGTIFSYTQGKCATIEYATAPFATISGYKVFAAALEPNDDLTHVLAVPLTHPIGRAVFISSGIETRRYELVFPGDGSGNPDFIFDYAVDASHGFPPDYEPGGYIDVPGGFPPEANQLEPFILDVQLPTNTAYLSTDGCVGGILEMLIRISDWQALIGGTPIADQIAGIEITSPTLFLGKRYTELVSDWTPDAPWATYRIILEGITPDSNLDQQILVSVISAEGDYQTDVSSYIGSDPLTSFFVVRVPVSMTAPIGDSGFALNPLAPWPKPGGNIYNSNTTNALGPLNPDTMWQIPNINSDAMPVVDPEGRIFAARELDPVGVNLLAFDSSGNQVADVSNTQFEPEASPMLVGCSLLWNDIQGRVVRLYQDGGYELLFTPMNSIGPYTYGMLNIDEDGHGFVHGPASIQAFDKNGGFAWVRFGIDGAPSMFIGPPTVAGDGRIIVGKVDLDTLPPSNFEFWGLNADTGEIEWEHTPLIEDAVPYGSAADPNRAQIYYTINNLLVALSEDGEQRWYFEGGDFFLSQIAVAPDGTIYVAESVPGQTGGTSRIIAVNPDGGVKWFKKFDNGITGGPIVDNSGSVFFASSDGSVRCLGFDGSLRWTREVDGYPVYVLFGAKYSLLVGVRENPYEDTLVILAD